MANNDRWRNLDTMDKWMPSDEEIMAVYFENKDRLRTRVWRKIDAIRWVRNVSGMELRNSYYYVNNAIERTILNYEYAISMLK